MIKHCAVVAWLAVSGFTVAPAEAAREQHTFQLYLEVPTRAFYIMPVEPDWIHQPQRLEWDHVTSELGSVRKYFDVRHASSAVQASLESVPFLLNGQPGGIIALKVRFNDVVLQSYRQDVVSQEDAAVGARVLLEITPVKPAEGYQAGDYSGNVMLMFNARAPGA